MDIQQAYPYVPMVIPEGGRFLMSEAPVQVPPPSPLRRSVGGGPGLVARQPPAPSLRWARTQIDMNEFCSRPRRTRPETVLTYRGTSPIRKCSPLGPYSKPMPMVLGCSQEGGHFLMGDVPLQGATSRVVHRHGVALSRK